MWGKVCRNLLDRLHHREHHSLSREFAYVFILRFFKVEMFQGFVMRLIVGVFMSKYV